MAVTTRNPRDGVAPQVPERPEGGLYRFEMIFDGGRFRAYADSATELCGQLIEGYGELESQVAQAAARIQHAVRAQVLLQAAIVADADLASCSAGERATLVGPRHVPPAVAVWEADVPLVLVDVYYEPLGELPLPVGRPRGGGPERSNLVWLRPGDEAELLSSLAEAGVVVLSELD